MIREGARAKEYETAIMWLSDCGLVHKVSRITTPHLPLKAYEDLKAFKLFLVDVGLLGALAGLNQKIPVSYTHLDVYKRQVLLHEHVQGHR